MNTHAMKRITVICEAIARDSVLRLAKEAGAQGWTLWDVQGSGSQGPRLADIPEFTNIHVEIILQPASAQQLLQRLASELFPQFAMVAYETDIRVLRSTKF